MDDTGEKQISGFKSDEFFVCLVVPTSLGSLIRVH